MEGPLPGPGGEDITWPDQVAPRGERRLVPAKSNLKPQTSSCAPTLPTAPREKEAYAIVMALRKWAGYIILHPATVCTDHQSLQSWHKEHVDTPSRPAS